MDIPKIFQQLLVMSIYGSMLGIIILIVKSVFKNRISTKLQYYLWFILLVKLLLPLNFQTYINPLNHINISSKTVNQANNFINTSALNIGVNSAKPDKVKETSKTNGKKLVLSNVDRAYVPSTLSVIWLIGFTLLFSYILLANIVLYLRIKKYEICKDDDINRIVEESKAKLGLRNKVSIIYYEKNTSPAVYGIVSPKVLVSSHIIKQLSHEELRYVFLHELSHIRRKDLLVNLCAILIECIYWFNPIIWYLMHSLKQDCEIACDSTVIKVLSNEEKKDYGQTIINMMRIISKPNFILGTMGFSNRYYRRRISMLFKFNRKSITAALVAFLTVFGAGFTFTVGKQNNVNALEKSSNKVTLQAITKVASKSSDSKKFKSYFSLLGLSKAELKKRLNEKPVKVDEGGLEFSKAKIRIWFNSNSRASQVFIMDKTMNINGVKVGDSIDKFRKVFGKPTKSTSNEIHFKYEKVFLIIGYDNKTNKAISVYVLKKDY